MRARRSSPSPRSRAGAKRKTARTERRLLWIVPVLAAGLVHVGVLRNDFAYDDVRVIEALRAHRISLAVVPARSASGDRREPPMLRDQETRPLTYALHLVDHRVWGERPFGYHLTNLLLHMIATGLVLVAARSWTGTTLAALVAALVFAIHPLHVEAVASFANRKDVLALIFALAAFLVWIRVRPGARRWLGTAAFMALGLAAKEIAVVGLPVILLAADGLLGRGREALRPRPWQVRSLQVLAGGLVALVAAGLLAGDRLPFFSEGSIRAATEEQLHDYPGVLANAALAFGRLVRSLLVPVGLSADSRTTAMGAWTRSSHLNRVSKHSIKPLDK